MEEILRGHFEECLKDFGNRLNSPGMPMEKKLYLREAMANFCSSADDTVRRWLKGNSIPLGLTKLKAIIFLETIGYTIIVLQRNKESVSALARILAFNLLSPEEAAKEIGYVPDSLMRIFFGEIASDSKTEKIREINKRLKQNLEQKIADYKALGLQEILMTASKTNEIEETVGDSRIIRICANSILGLNLQLQELSPDEKKILMLVAEHSLNQLLQRLKNISVNFNNPSTEKGESNEHPAEPGNN